MGALELVAAAAAVAAAVSVVGCVPVAHASEHPAINGTFAVLSNGEWATTNEVYRDEAVVRSTWTVSTSCSTLMDCTGTVTSDQGWTAPINLVVNEWHVLHTVKNWVPCPDGTFLDGSQLYRFYPVDDRGDLALRGSSVYAGTNRTTAPSGGCGRNAPLVITMPLRLNQIAVAEP
jgi:hypothetical protein